MKPVRILVAVMTIAMSLQSAAEEVTAYFGKFSLPTGLGDHIVFSEINCGKTYYIAGVAKISVENLNAKYATVVNKTFLHWYKSDRLAIVPCEDVVVDGVTLSCVDAAHTGNPTASVGEVVSDASACTITWTGECSDAFSLAADDMQLRVNSIGISYRGRGSSGVDVVSTDADEVAPVEYFNLQGVRVVNPSNGIFIRRQGSKVSKVIM